LVSSASRSEVAMYRKSARSCDGQSAEGREAGTSSVFCEEGGPRVARSLTQPRKLSPPSSLRATPNFHTPRPRVRESFDLQAGGPKDDGPSKPNNKEGSFCFCFFPPITAHPCPWTRSSRESSRALPTPWSP
jgi:hypothetical protein